MAVNFDFSPSEWDAELNVIPIPDFRLIIATKTNIDRAMEELASMDSWVDDERTSKEIRMSVSAAENVVGDLSDHVDEVMAVIPFLEQRISSLSEITSDLLIRLGAYFVDSKTEYAEILEWCRHNVNNDWEGYAMGNDHHVVIFYDETDKVAFDLRWRS